MTRREEAKRKSKERKEAEKRNPLLKMGLGDLLNEMLNYRVDNCGNIIYYQAIIAEINRKEKGYMRAHPKTRYLSQ